jgi:Ca2+-binding EF-hand superfamily protein
VAGALPKNQPKKKKTKESAMRFPKLVSIALFLTVCSASMAGISSSCTLGQFRAFSAVDMNRDGTIDTWETRDALVGWATTVRTFGNGGKVQGVYRRYDMNQNGRVDTNDVTLLEEAIRGSDCDVADLRAYSYIDLKKDGLTPSYQNALEYYNLARRASTGSESEHTTILGLFRSLDFNRTGRIEFEDRRSIYFVLRYTR